MRNLNDPMMRARRDVAEELRSYGVANMAKAGVFWMRSCVDHKWTLVIASSGCGWDHVSVSREDRAPTWREMTQVRYEFFTDEESVMQVHPPKDEYVDGSYPGGNSRFTLHLWRPTDVELPRPPRWMVGAMSKEDAEAMHALADREMDRYEAERGVRIDRLAPPRPGRAGID